VAAHAGRFMIAHTIQSNLFSRSGGQWIRWHAAVRPTRMATRTCSTCSTMGTTSGSTITGRIPRITGIPRTRSSSVLARSFFPRSSKIAVFLCGIFQAFAPSTKHLSGFTQFQHQLFALSVGNELSFPCHGDEELQKVECCDALLQYVGLFFFGSKIGCVRPFQKIKKRILDSAADGVPCTLGNMRHDSHPDQISLFHSMDDGCTLRERELSVSAWISAYHFGRELACGVGGIFTW
jgi:hypothetical protein